MEGWIKLHRKIADWEWWDDVPTRNVFMVILLHANHKQKEWRGISIEAGQFLTSRDKLARLSGFSEQQVRTALNRLKSTNEITIQTTSKNTVITVVCWNNYQDINQQVTSYATSEQPSTNQQSTTTKNDKNDKNITPKSPKGLGAGYSDEFELFWKTYKRKNDDKSPAFKSWERAVKGGVSPEDIISKAKEYLGSISPDKRHGEFQKRAATWLIQKGWENTYTPFGAAVAHKGSQLDILSMSDEEVANARGFDMITGQFKTRFNKDYFANNKTQPGGSKGLKEAMIEALKKPPLRG